MSQIVECVPNFSEGRDLAVIKQITDEIEKVDGAKLLDVDPGADTNRTVVTLVGSPDAAVEAAFQAIKKASELIDMRQHSGAHPRMGATDVCPFIPVANMTMEDCAELARRLGKRVGEELGIPVYLYEFAASREDRRNLADIRAGEYEALPEKMKDTDFAPDFGPAQFNAQSGATVIGARKFLIAYNVNLNTQNRKMASDIALDIREKGRAKRDAAGKIIRDADGKMVKVPGTLRAVKAVGWYIDEYKMAQISMNLVDFDVTPLHKAFDEVCEQATRRGLRVTGSELVGLVPLSAMLDAGKHYLKKQGNSTAVSEKELVRLAIQSMGLSEISPFDPEEKIIEYQLRDKNKPSLLRMQVDDFADELASDSPAPGGGSVAALAGSLGAALVNMVGVLTFGKKGYEAVTDEVESLSLKAGALKDKLLKLVDEDTESFNQVMAAMRMKKKTDEQKAARAEAIERATQASAKVPFKVMESALAVGKLAAQMAKVGNQNSLSDAGVGILMARAALEGAAMNVLINLQGLSDKTFMEEMTKQVTALRAEMTELADSKLADIFQTLQ
ncbi:MAG: glutamate formimidoyltransferase [Candidatus Marinimicrobia bacterium]|nr:glutamate formimidoyltransferase [Candidatus Neomarinimicrobiota bacterium]MCF7840212.1 glutamate formimidoyltransferase [Candidatus Neomarinimicrobiota bacterium]MCF7902382.1 glutamate formimidoyltransferase [Candidatus Neomarinimicrobiota bacterium]